MSHCKVDRFRILVTVFEKEEFTQTRESTKNRFLEPVKNRLNSLQSTDGTRFTCDCKDADE
jgi:hypothetical protein